MPDQVPEKEPDDTDRADAMQKLAELTEELGLYDELERADAAAVLDDDIGDDGLTDAERTEYAEKFLAGAGSKSLGSPACPFCGAPMPCVPHRSGG